MNIPEKLLNEVNKFVVRYDRNYLKNRGDSLAFFDNSALGKESFIDSFMNADGTFNMDKKQAFISFCKAEKIRPVLSSSVVGELVKGLPNDINEQRKNLEQKKKEVLHMFQESGLLWALPINAILDLEYFNLHSSSSDFSHNYLRIFSRYPLVSHKKVRKLKHYPCDQALNYSLWPDFHTVKHKGDIREWLEKEIIPELNTIKEDHNKYDTKIAGKIDDTIEKLLPGKADMKYSPFIFIWDNIRGLHGKTLNDRLDAFYGAFALSYCDYFVVDDGSLFDVISSEKDKQKLEVKVVKSEEFFKN